MAKSSGAAKGDLDAPRRRRRTTQPAAEIPAADPVSVERDDRTDFEQLRDEQIGGVDEVVEVRPTRSRRTRADRTERPAPVEREPEAREPVIERPVVEEPAPSRKAPVREVEEDSFGAGLDSDSHSEPAPRAPAPASFRAEASDGGDDGGFEDADGGSDAGDSETDAAPGEGDGQTDEGGGRRRRRRRRRRSKGGATGQGGAPAQQAPPHQHQPQAQQHRQHQGQQGGQRRGRGGRDFRDNREPREARGQYGQHPQNGPDTGAVVGTTEGALELHPKGYGFLRDPKNNYAAMKNDPFVSSTLIEKFGLREGVLIHGDISQGVKGQGPRVRTIHTIDGRTVEEYQKIKPFDTLTAINPFEQIKLETGAQPVTMRVIDLLAPIGKGQRALIVAPPRTGKTMLLQEIANSVTTNHPEITLMVLLIDERPEEVTEMRRRVRGEVIASSLDREVESHIRIAQLIVERGKRLAESGKDVFILLDSITRTARAYNKMSNSGRTGTGGLDIRALDIPKKLFGTARRFDEGGSLTVVGTALIDTGSRMDEAIFQEFKGTGNMELVLDRRLADRRVWPAIDIRQSGTRREEKILSPEVLEGVTLLRRSLVTLDPVEAMEQLIKTLGRFPSNKDFLAKIRAMF